MMEVKITVPGSKSVTQRAIAVAALADGASRLVGPLESEDTRLFRAALSRLGIMIEDADGSWMVHGQGGRILPAGGELFMGNNGTGIRFLASIVALGEGRYVLGGTERMAERPIEPLLSALRAWGAGAVSLRGTGCPPVAIEARGLEGGEVALSANLSSQYLSSLLIVAPYARKPARIRLDGPLVSRPYVDITLSVMASFGIEAREEEGIFTVPRGIYQAREYRIEGDASSASYFWAGAAVTGGCVTVANIPQDALQGDAAFADILGLMGCSVEKGPDGVTVQGPKDGLTAIEIDMGKWPDVVPTLAVTAAFARGRTVIRNVAHLRIKETDRLRAVAVELGRLGADVSELPDGLVIEGGRKLHGGSIRTYDDHRIAMAFAVAGLRVPGVVIEDPGCVRKSFPEFWDLWSRIRPLSAG
ncbi:MAG: 3-phosphoshikimate 1-carboxyvinyltransferase [Deltaproteobacteria bacterium]